MNIFIQILIFILSLLVFYYLPAETLFTYGNVKLKGWRRAATALVVGISLATVSGLLYAVIQVRYLVFPTLLIISLLAIRKSERWRPYLLSGWSAPHAVLLILSILFSVSVITSGWFSKAGLILRSYNTIDSIWFFSAHTGVSTLFLDTNRIVTNSANR
jgi:Zn-dependent protease with chaperone function